MDPLITIAIPVYNVERYIKKSLISALSQDYDNLEILVIDDKGTDNSMKIVMEIIETHPRGHIIRIIDHKINQGTGATKNTSISEAKGEYIFFMDSDDYIPFNTISIHYHAIGLSDMTIGSYDEYDENGDVIGLKKLPNKVIGQECPLHEFMNSDFGGYVQTWNKLYRINLLRDNKVWCIPSNRNEDVFFTFQLLLPVKSISYVDKITYHYNVGNPNSTMYAIRNEKFILNNFNQFIGVFNQMVVWVNEHNCVNNTFISDFFWIFYLQKISIVLKSKYLTDSQKEDLLFQLKSIDYSIFYYKQLSKLKEMIKIRLYLSLTPKIYKIYTFFNKIL